MNKSVKYKQHLSFKSKYQRKDLIYLHKWREFRMDVDGRFIYCYYQLALKIEILSKICYTKQMISINKEYYDCIQVVKTKNVTKYQTELYKI